MSKSRYVGDLISRLNTNLVILPVSPHSNRFITRVTDVTNYECKFL